jgi:DNA primase
VPGLFASLNVSVSYVTEKNYGSDDNSLVRSRFRGVTHRSGATTYPIIDSADGLAWIAQQAALEVDVPSGASPPSGREKGKNSSSPWIYP